MKLRTVVFCGGGSGGHVVPALSIIRKLQKEHPDIEIQYIGSHKGIEHSLVKQAGLPFYSIATGKLRRYFSWQNFVDIFKVAFGILQSFLLLWRWRRSSTLVFSTGGFVTVPVVIAAWLQRKKIFIHEQTSRAGLANKIGSRLADTILISFAESKKFFPTKKTILTGYPLRDELLDNTAPPLIDSDRPLLFVTGGGNGSTLINETVDSIIDEIRDRFFIIHQVGKKFEQEYASKNNENYRTFGFIGSEIISYLKQAQVIISRAGAGTVMEILALGKPSIFIPLKGAQKNEQWHNAQEAQKKLGSIILKEDELNSELVLDAIAQVLNLPSQPASKQNPSEAILKLIVEAHS